MKNLFKYILFTSLLMIPNISNGEEKLQLTMPGTVTGLKIGEQAPYNGVLFSIDAASWVLQQPQLNEDILKVKIQHTIDEQKAICLKETADLQAQVKADKAITDAISEQQKKYIETLTKKIEENEPCKWCYVAGGIVAGVIAGAATTYVIIK